MKEDYAIVLDFLPTGYPDSYKREPIAQVLGEKEFSLLEVVPREDIKLEIGDKVYIGADKREKIRFIKGRMEYNRLTTTGKRELELVVAQLVKQNEEKFVNFFNKTGAISIRQHSLELLPNIGKKHMKTMLEERHKKPFESFADIIARVKLMPDPARTLTERIMEEFRGESKYHIFTKRPAPPRQDRGRYY